MFNESIIAVIANILDKRGWQLIDRICSLECTTPSSLIFKHAYLGILKVVSVSWWPEGAHHLDDEPALAIYLENSDAKIKEGGFAYFHKTDPKEFTEILNKTLHDIGL